MLSVFIFSSCIKTYNNRYPYFYDILNLSGNRIKVVYKGLDGSFVGSPKNNFDSIIYIPPGEKRTLFTRILGECSPTPMRNPEYDFTLSSLNYLQIYAQDTISGNRNYLLTFYWDYQQTTEDKADLVLTIVDDDFSKK